MKIETITIQDILVQTNVLIQMIILCEEPELHQRDKQIFIEAASTMIKNIQSNAYKTIESYLS